MQDFLGSVRRSLVFRPTLSSEDGGGGGEGGGFGGFVEKINSSIRNSRIGLFVKPPREEAPPIRWRKGELIGQGAFGSVYMGMNLDTGELLAVKQVLIAVNSASKEKTRAHIQELEEEVRLLKNLSHPNIVRYLGTVTEDDSLNIFLEFVPGGSIASLLQKFGSFPESVIRMYTKQLLLGLKYLHNNGIMHRDIKGANILVDNKGCIKLADFGASKKVVELATLNGAKSMKGTAYWMAPEVILQTGHSFSADIWSVGCTMIEMATGKAPWSQQYTELFAALLHIGKTKSHPPIPEHLSPEAKDFLLKCLHKEPSLRPSASELLQHAFVTEKHRESHLASHNSLTEFGNSVATTGMTLRSSVNSFRRSRCTSLKDVCELGSMRRSTVHPGNPSSSGFCWPAVESDDLCVMDDMDDLCNIAPVKITSTLRYVELNKSCNPTGNWSCKFDESPEEKRSGLKLPASQDTELNPGTPCDEDDYEVTESKIRAFLDEKVLDMKRLQTPLYEEFYNNTVNSEGKSPKQMPSTRLSAKTTKRTLNTSRVSRETETPQINEYAELQRDHSFSEIRRKWEEELYEELEENREKLRRAGVGGKTSSPMAKQRERVRCALPRN